jgi:major type 1 subunit fimbrin (pilin)
MKKAVLTLTALSLFGLTSITQAATAGGSGTINFTGEVNNDACTVGNAVGNDKVISVEMGNVAIKDMGTEAAPMSGIISQRDYSININCNLGTKVSLRFSPTTGGPGVVPGKKVLALAPGLDSATGVGIALLDGSGNLIDLSSATTAKLDATLAGGRPGAEDGDPTIGGNSTVRFAAAYVTTGTALKPGAVNSTLPFILEYE